MDAGHANYLGVPELLRGISHADMQVLCIPYVTSLGFAYNVNHISMMSLWFAFHSCHA